MTRFDSRQLIMFRIILGAIGVAVWGVGYRMDDSTIRLAGMGILAVVLLMRWIPRRWLHDDHRPD